MSKGKIFIVDDDEAVRESLDALLSAFGYETGSFDSARSFLANCPSTEVGCLLADIRMPDMDGLELQEKAALSHPGLAIVIMTGHGDVPLAVRAMKAGAIDFVEKPFPEDVITRAVDNAMRATEMRTRKPAANPAIVGRVALLTAREREVLDGLVAGLPNKTIAYDLGISPRTVEIHRALVMEKMQARSLSELVRLALGAGLGQA